MKRRLRKTLSAAALVIFASSLTAAELRQKTSDHSTVPFQSEGLWVKTMLEFADANDRPMYQEIIPCRLIDTREASGFEAPYGGPTFQPGDGRSYSLRAVPPTNPCYIARRQALNPAYEEFYDLLKAAVLKVTWYNRSGDDGGKSAAGIVQAGEPEDLEVHGAIAAWFGWRRSPAEAERRARADRRAREALVSMDRRGGLEDRRTGHFSA